MQDVEANAVSVFGSLDRAEPPNLGRLCTHLTQEEVADDWSTDDYGGSWRTWQGFEDEEELENEEINDYGYENIQGNWVFDEVERLLEMGVEEIWECEWWLQMIEVEF